MFPIWIDKAIELRKDGLSYAKIGELLNTDRKKVSYYLQEKGYGPSKTYKKAAIHDKTKHHKQKATLNKIKKHTND